jgi:hypothetical protein
VALSERNTARQRRHVSELPRCRPTGRAPRLLGRQPRARAPRQGKVRPGRSVRLRPCRRSGTCKGSAGPEPAASGVIGGRSGRPLGSQWWALSYWRTSCRVLGKVLGELTRRLGKPLVKPNSAQTSAEIAPRRSPVRVRLAPSKPRKSGLFVVRRGASERLEVTQALERSHHDEGHAVKGASAAMRVPGLERSGIVGCKMLGKAGPKQSSERAGSPSGHGTYALVSALRPTLTTEMAPSGVELRNRPPRVCSTHPRA